MLKENCILILTNFFIIIFPLEIIIDTFFDCPHKHTQNIVLIYINITIIFASTILSWLMARVLLVTVLDVVIRSQYK